MSRWPAKNVVLAVSLLANVILATVLVYSWLDRRAADLGLASNREALQSVAGASLLPSVRIEFRIAEESPGEGLSEVQHEGHPPKLYVRPDVIVTNADIDSAKAVEDETGRPAVRLMLNDGGFKKLNVVAAANRMKMLAILIDGKAILAPVIEGPIEERGVMIRGALTKAETERIALAFARR